MPDWACLHCEMSEGSRGGNLLTVWASVGSRSDRAPCLPATLPSHCSMGGAAVDEEVEQLWKHPKSLGKMFR